ncbi:hypothetical protein NDU88_002119 [Pleurodeles waltl]|uniref:Uncharacterized protein n=1 Tax=Pleurodeles waltl TaxID=8319 RepID=A0AAV7T1A8_PLEWA|nr:hypothetical protein NDU88_002119 [Pleurodeles waltl]
MQGLRLSGDAVSAVAAVPLGAHKKVPTSRSIPRPGPAKALLRCALRTELRAGGDRMRPVRPTAWIEQRPRACEEQAPQGRGAWTSGVGPEPGHASLYHWPGPAGIPGRGRRQPLRWRPSPGFRAGGAACPAARCRRPGPTGEVEASLRSGRPPPVKESG